MPAYTSPALSALLATNGVPQTEAAGRAWWGDGGDILILSDAPIAGAKVRALTLAEVREEISRTRTGEQLTTPLATDFALRIGPIEALLCRAGAVQERSAGGIDGAVEVAGTVLYRLLRARLRP